MIKQSHFQFFIQRPVAMTMVTLGILVFGWVSYQKLSLSLMPKIDFPTLTIRTEYLGTAPSEIESLITKPLEEELSVLGGLVDYYSVSKAGFSEITLQFDWKTNLTYTSLQVREKLDRVKLPKDAKKPLILKYDPSQEPIIRFAIYKGKGLQHLQSIAEKIIEPKLQSILGVASVKIRGGLEQEIRVLVDEKKISHLSLSMKKIHQILRSENVNLAGGKLKEGKQEYFIRTLSEFQTIQDIRKIIVHQNQHRKVRLQDVAKVILTTKEQEMFSKVNGLPAVEILIFKEGDSNIVEVAKRVKNILIQKAIPKIKTKKKAKKKSRFSRFRKKSKFTSKKSSSIEEALKPNVQIKIISDQSVFIKQAIAEVGNSAKTGAIFAALVLLIFLNSLRSTLLILISIPISIIATFVLMFWIDISLNIMSLGGLALGLGMLVDNSIVVLESIHQEQEQGKSMLDAASIGVTKVGGAIIASTLTTVAVFFPIVFIEGFAGQIFRDQALTIVFSLLVSLLVALYLIPTFTVALAKKEQVSTLKDTETKEDSIQWIFKIPIQFFHFTKQFFFDSFQKQYYIQFWIFLWRLLIIVTFILPFALFLFFIPIMAIIYGIRRLFKTVSNQSKIKNIFSFFHTFIQFLQNKYAQLLSGLLKFPKTVLLVITSLFVLSIFGIQLLSSELIPEVHQGTLKLEIQLPVGTPLNETEQKFSFIEKKLHAIPQIASIFSFAGSDTKSVTTEKEGSHLGKFTLNLKKLPAEKWNQIEDQVIQQIQGFLADSSNLDFSVSRPSILQIKPPIEIEIQGNKIRQIAKPTQATIEQLKTIPQLYDIQHNVHIGNPEIQIIYKREQLNFYNLQIKDVAEIVRAKVLGEVPTTFKGFGEQIDILVKLSTKNLQTISSLNNLVINPNQKNPIRLSQVANIHIGQGPSEIRRNQQQRTGIITARVRGIDILTATTIIENKLAKMKFPNGFFYFVKGQNKEMESSRKSMIFALLLAIFLVYIVMASQFESFLQPFIIIFSIPFALSGVILGLMITNQSINVLVFIGLIMLAGIVVNNAIVLVDSINQLQTSGLDKIEAIIQAGRSRLRPILMTSLTTALGLLPMALGIGEGAEMRTPLAITVISGLLSSTLLSLVVIPLIYQVIIREKRPKEEQLVKE